MKVFIPEPIPGLQLVSFLEKETKSGSALFQSIPPQAYEAVFERVEDPSQADLILMAHEYSRLKGRGEYLPTLLQTMKAVGKKVLIVSYTDSAEPIVLDNALILRPSAYKSTLLSNEIVMPGYVEDLGIGRDLAMPIKSASPRIGFVGMVDFPSFVDTLKYLLRNYVLRSGPRRQGMYFRRKALSVLEKDPNIELQVIRRHSYSGNKKTIELSAEQARTEYIDSIINSHFTLAPRGDGNFSTRFFEVLSLGRIPILIDTDMALPLEDIIPYDDFILRVPYTEVSRVAEYVTGFWARHTEKELVAMGKKARETFEKHLYMPAFLRTILPTL